MMARPKKIVSRDIQIIFVSLFAVFGIAQIYQGYAASNPDLTLNPGTYKLSEFAITDQAGAYKFSLSKNLRYCVSQTSPPIHKFILLNTEVAYESVQLDNDSVAGGCFSPTLNFASATVSLPKGMETSGVLTVSTK